MIISTLALEEKYQQQLQEKFPDLCVQHASLDTLDISVLAETEILFTYGNDIPPERLAQMPNLKWIHIGQSGMDAIPMQILRERKIALTNSRGINSITIAEYVMCMLLNLVRNNYVFYEKAKLGIWDMETHLDELAEKTIGILGLGMVGKEIACRAAAFNMHVLGMNVIQTEIDGVEKIYLPQQRCELFAQCDYIVICMPLTSDTRGMLAAPEFKVMKPTAWLVNVGRGAIIDESCLVKALQTKQIAGAILDVFETEPLPAENALWKQPNVMITPHIAGDRQASYMPKMMRILCDNLYAYPAFNQMKNHVNLEQGF
ncbi:MAG: D-2-hydroxyacid dehydrogenase [Ruthenibacterium sp.]